MNLEIYLALAVTLASTGALASVECNLDIGMVMAEVAAPYVVHCDPKDLSSRGYLPRSQKILGATVIMKLPDKPDKEIRFEVENLQNCTLEQIRTARCSQVQTEMIKRGANSEDMKLKKVKSAVTGIALPNGVKVYRDAGSDRELSDSFDQLTGQAPGLIQSHTGSK